MKTRIDSVLAQSKWLALPAACFFLGFSTPPADRCVATFQESGEASDNARALVGHWRKTTVIYESVKDEHLVFHADGTVDNWVVTVSGPYEGRTSRTGTTTGHWIVEGKLLKIDWGDKQPPVRFSSTKGNWFCQIFRTTANSGIGSSSELLEIPGSPGNESVRMPRQSETTTAILPRRDAAAC